MDGDGQTEIGRTILRPKNEGEGIKKAEVVLRRRDMNFHAAADRQKKIVEMQREKKKRISDGLTTLRSLVLKKHHQTRDMHRFRKAQKGMLKKPKVVEGEHCLLVVRNSRKNPYKKTAEVLKEMNLTKHGKAIFVKNSFENRRQLQHCERFVFFGVVNQKTVGDMLHKKAHMRDSASTDAIPLSDNMLVEKHLGSLGMLCVDDMIHEFCNGKKNFDAVMDALFPFEFEDIRWAQKLTRDEEVVFGDLGHEINVRIAPVLG